MRYLSVCSGIEAASVAWEPLGWEAAAFSEIEAFPRAVLAHHYPETPCHGDFTTIGADDYGPIDLLVGGTPCQSFSIAGLRGGLGDDRGNLALEYLRLADRKRPRWLVWENVPGVLSSHGGRDFGSILGGLVELGYGFAYRVLDAQYFGVAQRRRRVFLVGYLGDWRPAAAVLFERQSLRGDTAPRREKRQVAPTIPSRSTGGGGLGTDFDLDGGVIEAFDSYNGTSSDVAPALCTKGDHASGNAGVVDGRQWPVEVAPTLNTRYADKQGLEDQHALGGAGHFVPVDPQETFGTLTTRTFNALGSRDVEEGAVIAVYAQEVADPLVAKEGATWTHEGENNFRTRNVTAFSCKDSGQDATEDMSPTLRSMSEGEGNANAGGQVAVAFDNMQITSPYNGTKLQPGDPAPTISAVSRMHMASASAVRRLTPRECERLQGFPDDYTQVPYRNKEAADGPRYKALGNSMAVPVMSWIGERISMVEAILEQEKAA